MGTGANTSVLNVDVAVIGSGFAGLSAALEARQRGANVVVLTRPGIFANNSSIGAGLFLCVGSPMQREKGIKDSPEVLVSDFLQVNPSIDKELLNATAAEATNLYQWLTGFGANFVKVMQFSGHSLPRLHRDASALGHNVLKGMFEATRAQGVDIRLGTSANDLLIEKSGRVTGVRAGGQGSELEVRASQGVVLCAGGFGRNQEMMQNYIAGLAGLHQLSAAGSSGDGLRMAMAAGAKVANMDAAIMTVVSCERRKSVTEEVFVEGGIFVNKDGQRFVNERAGRQLATFPLTKQRDHVAFAIFDEQTKQKVSIISKYSDFGIIIGPYPTAELAKKLGIDEKAFEKTMADYNQAQEPATDAYGHKFARRPLLGKLSAIPVTAAVVSTHGGAIINSKAQVIHQKGHPIPGLYAAGDNVVGPGGPAGKQAACPGYISGMGFFWALSTGRIAGRNVGG